jgi:SPP1 family predicted phage head-tail adaptor
MNPGDLDTKITIQTPTHTPSDLGEQEPSWATVATEWASKKHLRGQEYEQAQQIASETETKFTIWYSSNTSGITAKDKVVEGSIEYDILAAIPVPGGRPEKIELYTKRRSTDG